SPRPGASNSCPLDGALAARLSRPGKTANPCRPPGKNHHPVGGTFMPRIIEVTVSPQGETTIQTKGYAGSDCLQASKFLEQALGIATADHRTAEFYQSLPTQQHVQH